MKENFIKKTNFFNEKNKTWGLFYKKDAHFINNATKIMENFLNCFFYKIDKKLAICKRHIQGKGIHSIVIYSYVIVVIIKHIFFYSF